MIQKEETVPAKLAKLYKSSELATVALNVYEVHCAGGEWGSPEERTQRNRKLESLLDSELNMAIETARQSRNRALGIAKYFDDFSEYCPEDVNACNWAAAIAADWYARARDDGERLVAAQEEEALNASRNI